MQNPLAVDLGLTIIRTRVKGDGRLGRTCAGVVLTSVLNSLPQATGDRWVGSPLGALHLRGVRIACTQIVAMSCPLGECYTVITWAYAIVALSTVNDSYEHGDSHRHMPV